MRASVSRARDRPSFSTYNLGRGEVCQVRYPRLAHEREVAQVERVDYNRDQYGTSYLRALLKLIRTSEADDGTVRLGHLRVQIVANVVLVEREFGVECHHVDVRAEACLDVVNQILTLQQENAAGEDTARRLDTQSKVWCETYMNAMHVVNSTAVLVLRREWPQRFLVTSVFNTRRSLPHMSRLTLSFWT